MIFVVYDQRRWLNSLMQWKIEYMSFWTNYFNWTLEHKTSVKSRFKSQKQSKETIKSLCREEVAVFISIAKGWQTSLCWMKRVDCFKANLIWQFIIFGRAQTNPNLWQIFTFLIIQHRGVDYRSSGYNFPKFSIINFIGHNKQRS